MQDINLYLERAALLSRLKDAHKRQAQLYQELTDLLTAELAYSRYLIQAQNRRSKVCLKAATSEFLAEFRQRVTTIKAALNDTHYEIKCVLGELHLLQNAMKIQQV